MFKLFLQYEGRFGTGFEVFYGSIKVYTLSTNSNRKWRNMDAKWAFWRKLSAPPRMKKLQKMTKINLEDAIPHYTSIIRQDIRIFRSKSNEMDKRENRISFHVKRHLIFHSFIPKIF